jgi:hypothetical protein
VERPLRRLPRAAPGRRSRRRRQPRDLGSGDNELNFIKQVLESVSPDPATSAQTARGISIKQSDAEKLAATVEGDRV